MARPSRSAAQRYNCADRFIVAILALVASLQFIGCGDRSTPPTDPLVEGSPATSEFAPPSTETGNNRGITIDPATQPTDSTGAPSNSPVETAGPLIREFVGHEYWISALALSPDGRRLATADSFTEQDTICIWDVETGDQLHVIEVPDAARWLEFSPDGRWLAAIASGLRIFDAATGELAHELSDLRARIADFTPDGNVLVIGRKGYICNPASGEVVTEFAASGISSAYQVNVTSDGRYFVISSSREVMDVWDLRKQQLARQIDCPGERSLRSRFVSPDGKHCLSQTAAGNLRMYSVETGEFEREFGTQACTPYAAAFTPDGQYLLAVIDRQRRSSEIFRWHLESGKLVDTLHVHDDYSPCLALSSDGKYAFTAGEVGEQNLARMWRLPEVIVDPATLPPPRLAHPNDDGVRAVQFSSYSTLEVPSPGPVFDLNKDFTLEIWAQLGLQRRAAETIVSNDAFPEMNRTPRPQRAAGWALQIAHNDPDEAHYRWVFLVAGEETEWLRVGSEPIAYDDVIPWPFFHLAVTRDGERLVLYCDGQHAAATTVNEALVPCDESITLGTGHGRSRPGSFDGRIRGFHITQSVKYRDDFQPVLPLAKDDHSAVLFEFTTPGDCFTDLSGKHGSAVVSERWEVVDDVEIAFQNARRLGDLRLAQQYAVRLFKEAVGRAAHEAMIGSVRKGPRSLEAARRMAQVLRLASQTGDRPPAAFITSERNVTKTMEANAEPQSADIADMLEATGCWKLFTGELSKAQPLLENCLEIRRTILPANDLRVAGAELAVGRWHEVSGDEQEAESRYRAALTCCEAHGQSSAEMVDALLALARLEIARGRFDRARNELQRAEQTVAGLDSDDHVARGHVRQAQGELASAQRQFPQAQEHFEAAADIYERRASQLDICRLHVAQARSFLESREFARVQPLLDELEPVYRSWFPPHSSDRLELALLTCELHLLLSQTDQADATLQSCQRAIAQLERARLGSLPLVQAHLEDVLAIFHLSIGADNTAEQNSLQSLKIKQEQLADDDLRLALTLRNLGQSMRKTDRGAEAEQHFARARRILDKAYGPDSYAAAVIGIAMADSLNRRDEQALAAAALEQALAILDIREPQSPFISSAQYMLALLYRESGQEEKFFDVTDRSIRGMIAQSRRRLSLLGQQEQMQTLRANGGVMRLAYALSSALQPDARDAVSRTAEWHINSKSLMIDALSEQLVLSRNAADDETAKWRERMINAQSELAALATVADSGDSAWARYHYLQSAAQDVSDASRRLGGAVQRRAQTDRWVKLDEVRARIPADAVVVEYLKTFVAPPAGRSQEAARLRYVAWIIPPAGQGPVRLIDVGDAAEIEAQVLDAREVLLTPETAEVRRSLRKLSDLVLTPLLPHIRDTKRWIVCPDCALWLMPFATLLLQDDRHVVEAHVVSNLSSARDLLAADETAASTQPLVLAAPDYNVRLPDDAAVAGPFSPLPGTAREARLVAPELAKFAGVEPSVFTEASATERLVKSAHSPRVLMLSTHGVFEGPYADSLLNCSIALAGANTTSTTQIETLSQYGPDDDGLLTGVEILGIDLRGTQLAVLSACNTGVGKVQAGEGVQGLQQAFLLAGADAVVASLWSIPDEETATLMGTMFRRLAAGSDNATALCEAQRELMRGLRVTQGEAHPMLWGAFTITGRWQAPAATENCQPIAVGPLVEVQRFPELHNAHRVHFTGDGRGAIIHNSYRESLYPLDDLTAPRGWKQSEGHRMSPRAVFSRDGSTAYDPQWRELGIYQHDGDDAAIAFPVEGNPNEGNKEQWYWGALSPNQDALLLGGRRGGLRLWDIGGRRTIRDFAGAEQMAADVSFSADGSLVFAADVVTEGASPFPKSLKYQALCCWNRNSGEVLWRREIAGPYELLPGGRVLSIRGRDLELWDIASQKTIRLLHGHGEQVLTLDAATTGRLAVSTGLDRAARVWDVEAGVSIQTIRHNTELFGAAVSPSGRYFITATYQGVVLYRFQSIHVPKVVGGQPKAAVLRVWSDASGQYKVEAELVRVDGDNVVLKKTDGGELVAIPLDKLSRQDQDAVRNRGFVK